MEKVRDVMRDEVIALVETMNVEFAAQYMRDSMIGDVIVVDGSGAVCGIVTDRDIVVRVIARGLDPFDVQVGEICSRDVATLDLSAEVDDAITLMAARSVRRLPVLNGAELVGIVSRRDLTSAQADLPTAAEGELALADKDDVGVTRTYFERA